MSRRANSVIERRSWLRAPRDAATVALMAWTLGALAIPLAAAPESPETEAVEQYLVDLQLDALLASFLERRLERSAGTEKIGVAEELARVYARLLENASSAEEQHRWEQKAHDLLVAAPEADSSELRLGLARASYKRAEEVAERWRLRMVGRDEIEDALARLKTLIDRFDEVADEAHRRVRALEKQEETAPESSLELLGVALAEARRQRSLAHYLAGWAACYVAEIENDTGAADRALTHLGWLLNAKFETRADLERLPDQMLRYPHVARAAVAAGVCQSIRGRDEEALAWLARVADAGELPEGVLAQVLSRRLSIMARAQRWRELAEEVAHRRGSGTAGEDEGRATPLPVTDARLLAVLAFEARPTTNVEIVDYLRDIALGDLVARGELGHVLDLASLFGAESFGQDGFVSQQVRGLMLYNAARDAHRALGIDENEPVESPDVARRYLDAAALFEHAIKAPDAAGFTTALGNTMMLIGLCNYYAGASPEASARRAADWFVDAAARVPEESRAADALWMAIRALDIEIERAGDPESALAKHRDELIDRFLKGYPDHDRAAAMTLRLATGGAVPARRAIDLLLEVPEDSTLFETARRHATRLSYQLYRESTSSDRDWRALRYLELAEPLLAIDRRRASMGDAEAARLVSVRARRIAEASLAMSVPDVARAERALDVLVSVVSAGLVTADPSLQAEIDFRRAQIALERGDAPTAEAIVERLAGEDSKYASAGRRMVYRHALTTWRRLQRGDPAGEQSIEAARGVVRHGRVLIDELAGPEGPIDDPAVISLFVAVADAAADLALLADDKPAGVYAVSLYQRVLASHPATGGTLRRLAEVAERIGRDQLALESWRKLLAGLDDGSPEWFEARYRHVSLLRRMDPDRAREVLEQMAVLYPTFGPAPWNEKLRALHRELVGANAPRGAR